MEGLAEAVLLGGPEPQAVFNRPPPPGSGSKPVRACAVQAQGCFCRLSNKPLTVKPTTGTLSLGSHPGPGVPSTGLGHLTP